MRASSAPVHELPTCIPEDEPLQTASSDIAEECALSTSTCAPQLLSAAEWQRFESVSRFLTALL